VTELVHKRGFPRLFRGEGETDITPFQMHLNSAEDRRQSSLSFKPNFCVCHSADPSLASTTTCAARKGHVPPGYSLHAWPLVTWDLAWSGTARSPPYQLFTCDLRVAVSELLPWHMLSTSRKPFKSTLVKFWRELLAKSSWLNLVHGARMLQAAAHMQGQAQDQRLAPDDVAAQHLAWQGTACSYPAYSTCPVSDGSKGKCRLAAAQVTPQPCRSRHRAAHNNACTAC
jgi:hypothetical protein